MMGNSRSVAGVAIFRGIAEIMLNQRQTTAIGADKSGVCPKCLYGLFHNRHSRRLGACPSNRRVAIPARRDDFWLPSRSGDDGVPDTDGTPRSRAAEGGQKARRPAGWA